MALGLRLGPTKVFRASAALELYLALGAGSLIPAGRRTGINTIQTVSWLRRVRECLSGLLGRICCCAEALTARTATNISVRCGPYRSLAGIFASVLMMRVTVLASNGRDNPVVALALHVEAARDLVICQTGAAGPRKVFQANSSKALFSDVLKQIHESVLVLSKSGQVHGSELSQAAVPAGRDDQKRPSAIFRISFAPDQLCGGKP